MLESTPMTVGTRGRLYTTDADRDAIDVNPTPYGRGTPIQVGVVTVDRSPEWGTYAETAMFSTTLGYYGSFTIPSEVREKCDIAVGDSIRVTIQSDT